MTTISVRISDQLNHSLEGLSIIHERTKTFLVIKAIEAYLEDLEDYNLAEEGYKRYLASGKKTHSLKEVAKRLKINPKDL